MPEEYDFTDKYNTKLTPEQEKEFQKWAKEESKRQGRNVLKDLYDYDLRGLFIDGGGFGGSNGHATDTYKKPNHPTFSTGSKYSGVDGYVGGKWSEDKTGHWSFVPSATNFQMHGVERLKEIFKEQNPDSDLVFDDAATPYLLYDKSLKSKGA